MVLTTLTLFLLAAGVNIKKKNCGNQEYVGNSGGNYPHLHCDKDFLTLSEGPNQHTNYKERGECQKILKTFQDKQDILSKNMKITRVLQVYFEDNCPNDTLPNVVAIYAYFFDETITDCVQSNLSIEVTLGQTHSGCKKEVAC